MQIRKQALSVLLAGCILAGCEQRQQEFLLSAAGQDDLTKETQITMQADASGSALQSQTEDSAAPAGDPAQEDSLQKDPDAIPEASIYVDVCGAVQVPGVYEMPAQSRVFEAVSMAGGLTEEACASAVNQAQPLSDGQQLYIPTVREAEEGGSGAHADPAEAQTASDNDTDKVNINTADKQTLMTLKGIGEVRAEAILSYREAHGAFSSAEDLLKVSGIKERTLAKIRDRIVTG